MTDVNDNSPTFSTHSYQANVALDDKVGHHLLQVTATDPDSGDNGRMRYSITSGNSKEAFEINDDSGLITLKKLLAAFQETKFILTVQAKDMGKEPRTDRATVTLNVFASDGPPSFPVSPLVISVPEGITAGQIVAVIRAGTSEFLIYKILSRTDRGVFHLDAFSGELFATETLDYEKAKRFEFRIQVNDRKGHSDEVNVMIELQDINDNAPLFVDAENNNIFRTVDGVFRHAGDLVTQIEAYDGDAGDVLTYELSGDEAAKYLSVDGEGYLRAKRSLEKLKSLRFTLTARDNATTPHVTSADVRLIFLSERSGDPPVRGSVLENSKVGTEVAVVPKYFPDGTFTILLPESSSFSIDSNGKIVLAKPVDFETQRFELLTVRETSPTSSLQNDVKVEVSIIDVNDNDPVFELVRTQGRVNENSRAGSGVFQLKAHDKDSGSNGLVGLQLNTQNSPFAINPLNGMLEVGHALENQGGQEQHALDVYPYDHGHPRRKSKPIRINLDVAKLPPTFINFFDDGYKFEVSEQVPGGTVVGKVEAISYSGARMSYKIVDGNANNMFKITTFGGEIKVNFLLDYEKQQIVYDLKVRVLELVPMGLVSVVKVRVTVTNANDQMPAFSKREYTATTPEDTTLGSTVLTVSASDCDCSKDCKCSSGQLKYLVIDTDFFTVHPDTGEITPARSLDYETTHSYVFRVLAKDTLAGKTNTAVAYVKISVTNSNDNAPEFEKNYYRLKVSENAIPGKGFDLILARDADGGIVKYSIVSGGGPFQIDPYTGVLSLSKVLPRDTWEYTFKVRASDGVSDSDVNVFVYIEDSNDNRPTFTKCQSATVQENLPAGQFITQVEATDADFRKNGEVEYFLEEGYFDFQIDNTTGIIRSKLSFDREVQASYKAVVKAEDGGHGRSTAERLLSYCEITVDITDVNDQYPFFSTSRYDASVYQM